MNLMDIVSSKVVTEVNWYEIAVGAFTVTVWATVIVLFLLLLKDREAK